MFPAKLGPFLSGSLHPGLHAILIMFHLACLTRSSSSSCSLLLFMMAVYYYFRNWKWIGLANEGELEQIRTIRRHGPRCLSRTQILGLTRILSSRKHRFCSMRVYNCFSLCSPLIQIWKREYLQTCNEIGWRKLIVPVECWLLHQNPHWNCRTPRIIMDRQATTIYY